VMSLSASGPIRLCRVGPDSIEPPEKLCFEGET
jgi:hypothetical protein